VKINYTVGKRVKEGEVLDFFCSLNALSNACAEFLTFSRKPRLLFLSMSPWCNLTCSNVTTQNDQGGEGLAGLMKLQLTTLSNF